MSMSAAPLCPASLVAALNGALTTTGEHRQACEAALSSGRCDGPTTPDYCPYLTEQTKRLLGMAKAKA